MLVLISLVTTLLKSITLFLPPDLLYNFDKVTSKTESHGEEYDYASIMHYPLNAFAINRQRQTLVPLQNLNGKVPYVKISDSDVAQANKMYKCKSSNHQIIENLCLGSVKWQKCELLIFCSIDRLQSTSSWLTFEAHMATTKYLFIISDPIEPYIFKVSFIIR